MKYALALMLFFLCCLKLNNGQEITPPKNIIDDVEDYKPLKRVSRQDMTQPPEIPPPPDMQSMNFESNLRKKREAKGISGALPTRKG